MWYVDVRVCFEQLSLFHVYLPLAKAIFAMRRAHTSSRMLVGVVEQRSFGVGQLNEYHKQVQARAGVVHGEGTSACVCQSLPVIRELRVYWTERPWTAMIIRQQPVVVWQTHVHENQRMHVPTDWQMQAHGCCTGLAYRV